MFQKAIRARAVLEAGLGVVNLATAMVVVETEMGAIATHSTPCVAMFDLILHSAAEVVVVSVVTEAVVEAATIPAATPGR